MKKEGILVALFLILILLVNLISASPITIKTDGKEYKIDLIAVNRDSTLVRINNENRTIRKIQTPPYTPEIFSPLFPELKYVLTSLNYGTYLGDVRYINLMLLVEKNISLSGTKKVALSYQGQDYSVEIPSIASVNQANIRLNNGSDTLATVQTSPYTPDKISSSSDLLYVLTYVDSNSANVLLGFEVNILFECSENWNCSNWSSCNNNQQTRECKDSNNCGTKQNIPELTQECTSEVNTTILPPPCTDECPASTKACFNESSFKSCSDIDNDNCTEWNNPVLCSGDGKMGCSGNGECLEIPKSNNNLVLWIILGLLAVVIVVGFGLFKFKIIRLKKVKRKKRR